MEVAKIEIVVPFFWYRFPSGYQWADAVEELLSLDGKISINTISGKPFNLSISCLSKPEDHEDYYSQFKPKEYKYTHVGTKGTQLFL